MSPVTAMPSRRSRGTPVGVDVAAMRRVLEEHRAARSDQLKALQIWRDDGGADVSELGVARTVLNDVEAALGRLDDGTYGWCARCDGHIGAERLNAAPRTRLCIGCANEE